MPTNAELRALPWPYGELYAKAVTDALPGRAHWEEGVDFAKAQQLELWPGLEELDMPVAKMFLFQTKNVTYYLV
jgi:hypothetical protein